MKLEKGPVELKYLTINDAYTSVVWRNNPKIWEQTVNSPDREITIQNELDWINKVIKENNSHRFAILYKGIYVGNIQLTNIEENESYYGVFIGDTNYWGKGIGIIATNLILDFGFNTLNLHKIKLRVRHKNQIAFDLYKNLGFKEISRDHELIYMELLNDKYQMNAGSF